MEEKLRFVFSYERDQQSMTDRCLEFGVSRETGACVAAPLPAIWGLSELLPSRQEFCRNLSM
jgi:hypothetical protein